MNKRTEKEFQDYFKERKKKLLPDSDLPITDLEQWLRHAFSAGVNAERERK